MKVLASLKVGDLLLSFHPTAFRDLACCALPPFFGSAEAGVFGLFGR
jgi:hypothetical protein